MPTLASIRIITNHARNSGTFPDPLRSTQAIAPIAYRKVAVKDTYRMPIHRISRYPPDQPR